MTSSPGPVVQRALLSKQLTEIRHRSGRSEDEAAAGLGWPTGRLIRIESGLDLPAPAELAELIGFYGIDDEKLSQRLHGLAEGGATAGWWEPYKAHIDDPAFYTYLQHEAGTSKVEQFQSALVPGLLQTERYAVSVLRQFFPGIGESRLNALVEMRMRRQAELEGRLQVFVIDESVIQRRVGGADVMREQIGKILTFARMPHITVQVLPLSEGESFGIRGPFGLLSFAEGLGHVLYLERTPGSVTYVRSCAETAAHRAAFLSLRQTALSDRQSESLIVEVARSLDDM
ncbi:helix-turn-helix transcriptional regulator [Actinomadura sp. 6K520]|uniref:helix-turn-helix domain-containing protein n=1 Tax=Actinomadura sp. 6K520 TaxID=2530364 RepID=UPI00104A2F4C|nr:helix-turn-helix transcriptional regulator [Actinomadura sp. 6K520]TDE39259.1 XRE family transcriptional regulator [Actinomadura sp. 6K520]